MPENEIYKFLKANNLTSKDEASFTKEYSDPEKAQELHRFMSENELTTKDSATFYETYFNPEVKKKEESKPTVEDFNKKYGTSYTPQEFGAKVNSQSESTSASTSGTSDIKTVEEFNAKYQTDYTDLATGKKKVGSAEKSMLVPFSPIKVKQQSTLEDYIAPTTTLPDLNKAPMKRYENAYKSINSRIDVEGKKFENITLEIEKQAPQVEKGLQQFENELKQASDIIQKELSAKFQPMVDSKKMTVEQANAQFKAEYDKGYDIAQAEITKKYGPALKSYNKLIEDRKTIGNGIKTDVERAKLLANSVNIIDRNVRAGIIAEESNMDNAVQSGLYQLGSMVSGTLPYFTRQLSDLLVEKLLLLSMPDAAFRAMQTNQDLQKTDLFKSMESQAKELAKKGQYYSQKIEEKEGTVLDNFEAGNYAKAVKVAGIRFTESIPVMAAAIGMTALTGSPAAAIPLGGVVFGGQNYYGEYADRTDMSESDKLGASYIKGTLEMATEISVLPLLAPLKNLLKTAGKEAAKEAVKKTLFGTIKAGYEKFLPAFGWVQEGGSEYVNELAATVTDKLYDPKFKDKDWNEVIKEGHRRGLEAFGPGAFGGAAFTLPTLINNGLNKYRSKLEARGYEKELSQIDMDIANPSLTVEAKNILIDRKKELHGKLNKAFDTDKQDTAGATTEQLSILDDINDRRDVIENALLDETLTPESKKAFEEDKKKLELEEKDVLDQIKANEVVDEKEKVKGETKFYQGIDFNAQTGLPNGNYTEQEVAAARLPKINAEIARREAAKEEVDTKILDEKKRLEGILEKGKTAPKTIKVFRTTGTGLGEFSVAHRGSGTYYALDKPFQALGRNGKVEELEISIDEKTTLDLTVDANNAIFSDIQDEAKKRYEKLEESKRNQNAFNDLIRDVAIEKGYTGIISYIEPGAPVGEREKIGREYVSFKEAEPTNKPKTTNKNEKDSKQSTNEANGEVVLEGVSETGNENEGRKSSEQLREEEIALENKIIVAGLNGGFTVSKKTQQKSNENSVQYKEAFDPRTESGENAGESFVKIIEKKGKKYRVIGLRINNSDTYKNSTPNRNGMSYAMIEDNGNLPDNIDDLLIKKAIQEGKDLFPNLSLSDGDFILPKEYKPKEATKEVGTTNEELLSNLPSSRDSVNNAPVSITDPKEKFGNTKTRYIPFSIIEKAQKNDKLGGQTAREIAQRGGYSDRELDALYPNWRKEIAELNKPKTETTKSIEDQIAKLRAEEQAELDAKIPNAEKYRVNGRVDDKLLTNPEDIAAYEETYEKYNGPISDLLAKQDAEKLDTDVTDVLNKVNSGKINADDAAIQLDESGVEVSNEVYDQLREAEKNFKKGEKGLQVGDTVTIKGKNGNPDFKGNFRGITKEGKYVVVNQKGDQSAHDKADITEQPTKETPKAEAKSTQVEVGKSYTLDKLNVGDRILRVEDGFEFLIESIDKPNKGDVRLSVINAKSEKGLVQNWTTTSPQKFKLLSSESAVKSKELKSAQDFNKGDVIVDNRGVRFEVIGPDGKTHTKVKNLSDTAMPGRIDSFANGYKGFVSEGAIPKEKPTTKATESEAVKAGVLPRIKNAFLKIGTEIFDNAKALMAKAESLSGDVRKNITAGFETRDGKPIGFNYDTDQVARERFDFSKLKQIGKGSDRTVFELGDGKVLKVAHTARGLEQNIYEGDYYLKGIIPEVFERGLNYVVVEETPRLKSSDIVPTYDVETNEENGTATAGEMIKELSLFNQSDFDKRNNKLQDVLTKYGFQDILSYEVLYGDFNAIRNWGYKNGIPMHLDGGTFGGVQMITKNKGKAPLSDPEFRDIYNKSKQLKKQFGDTDKNTRFNIVAPDGTQKQVKIVDAEVVNGFYSPLEAIINGVKQDKMPAKQWIEKFAKGEEAKWTGLTDWLSSQTGSVSKTDIQNYLKDNRIEIAEVVKGQPVYEEKNNKWILNGTDISIEFDGTEYLISEGGEVATERDSLREAKIRAEEMASENYNILNNSKFSQWQLEGEKENYKEVLVTLPSTKSVKRSNELKAKGVENLNESEKKEYLELLNDSLGKQSNLFRSSHFDEANILVHLRMNTRTDSQGNKVLFLEEIQSDWGQEGKKKGFKGAEPVFKVEKVEGGVKLYADGKLIDQSTNDRFKYTFNNDEKYYIESFRDAVKNTNERNAVPSAPFVMDTNAWTKLGLKVALKEAVKQGANKLAWTTGEQQNDRYSLEKIADEVRYSKNEDGTYRAVAYKNGENISENKRLNEKELESNFGKEVAQRIIDGVGEDIEGEKSLTGENLKVGGKGMKGFYGSSAEGNLGIVGNVAKSLFKQEPGTVDFSYGKGFRMWDKTTNTYLGDFKGQYTLYDKNDNITKVIPEDYQTPQEVAKELGYDYKNLEVIFTGESKSSPGAGVQQSIDITPELAATVEQGQPLFHYGPKGEILGFTHNGKIYLNGEKITAKTTMEEAGHVWVNWAKENRADLYKAGLEKIAGSQYLADVMADKNYQAEALKVGKKGSEAYNAYMAEEALAKAIADEGAKFVTESKKADFRQWLAGIWKAVAKEFGIRDLSPQQVSKLTLEQFTKKVAADVFNEEPAAAMDVNERNRQIEILDNEKKIAQLEKEIRRAPVRGSKGQLSKKQLGIQLRNIKDQQRELKGLPPRKKVKDSVLNINKRKFSNVVDMSQLSFDEQLIFSAIGTLSANDKDIVTSDANKQLRQQGALVKQGGLTIDQIVTDFINENELDADMAQDFRNTLIDFVNGGDAYAWMNNIKEREAEMNPDAIRENEYYDDAYDVAMEYDLTDEEINEIELELIKQNDLTQEEYENIKNEFSNEGAEEGIVTNESETNSSEEKGPAELELEKQIEAAKNRLSEAKKELQKKEKEFGGKVTGDLFGKPKLEGALFEEELSDEVYQKAIKPYREDVVVAQRELDQLQDPKRKANAIDFDNKQNKLDLNGNLASAAAKLTTEQEAEIADLKEQLKNTKLPSQKAKIMLKIAAIEGQQRKTSAPKSGLASTGTETPVPKVINNVKEAKAVLFNYNLRIKEILNSIGVPVAEGRLSKKYLGMFYFRNKSIRVQSLYGVATACHEAAHYISDKFGIGKAIMNPSTIKKDNPNAAINKDIRKALTDIYVEYYPGAKETDSLRLRMEEGIAVLLERYLVDPSGISQKYGLLVYNFINPTGLYYNEMFTDLLDKLNKANSDYASLTALEKVGTRIARGKEVLKRDTGFTWAQKNVFNWVYNGEPLRRADRTAGVQYKNESSEVAHIRWSRRAGLITPWVTGDVDSYLLTNKGWVKSGLSVKQYLTLVKGQEAEFSSYLVARRNVEDVNYQTELENELMELLESINDEELTEEEIEKILKKAEEVQAKLNYISNVIKNNKFDIEIDRNAVKANEGRFKEAADIFDKINDAMAEFAHTTGLLSAEKLASYKNVKGYASNKRLTYDDIESKAQGAGSNSQNRIGAFKPREGSAKSIVDPVYSQIQFITETMSKGLQNSIWQNLAKLGNNNVELARRFELQTTAPLFDPQTSKISYPQMQDKALITVWNNGKPSFYLAGAEYLEFAETMNSKEFEAFGAILKEAATVFSRFTTTANPLFPLVNIPIDTVSAWMNTKTGFVPVVSQLSSLKDMTRYGLDYVSRLIRVEKWYNSVKNKKIGYLLKDDLKMFEKYLALGGSLNNLSAYYDMTPEEMIKALNTENVLKKGYKNVKNATLGLLELPGNMSENLTRFAEFKKAKEKGYSDDVAMYMAAHVSTPFIQQGNMGGRVGQTIEKSIPYFHSALQVLGKYSQQVNEDPIRVATITAGMITIAMSSVLATLAYSDDDDKKVLAEQTTDQLSKNIYFPKGVFGGKGFVKIRIPESIGMYTGAMAMAVLQQKELVKKYTPKDWITATTVAVPSQLNAVKPVEAILAWVPQVLKPSLEVITNTKSYPEVAPIVNEGLARKLAQYEYNQYTSLYARELGEMTNMSPILIEHFVKAQFGKVPDMLLDWGTEKITGVEAPKKSMINIDSKDFILRGRAFNEFYKNAEDWSEKRNSIKDIKADDGNTEGLKMNAKTFEKTKDLIKLLQGKVNEGKVIPIDMKNDLYNLIENLNNSENPKDFNGARSELYLKALEL